MEVGKTMINQQDRYLRLVNLSKFYEEGGRNRVVLHETSLEVARGEVVAILGKSGSGKTTLLNLISGIDEADAGDIYLGEQNLTEMNETARTMVRRKNIGFVFQFFNLIPTLTVWENLVLPLELNEMTGPSDLERAHELLNEVGLTGREKAFPDRLSGGEQQRIAIARALVHDPQLLLADEPTGNLDEETGQHVLDLFDRLIRKTGKSVVMVTHSNDAAASADRALLLREGRLSDYRAGI
jgi:putative ABC transport system ATP-binding protein